MARGRPKKTETSGSVETLERAPKVSAKDFGDDLPKRLVRDASDPLSDLGLYEYKDCGIMYQDGNPKRVLELVRKK